MYPLRCMFIASEPIHQNHRKVHWTPTVTKQHSWLYIYLALNMVWCRPKHVSINYLKKVPQCRNIAEGFVHSKIAQIIDLHSFFAGGALGLSTYFTAVTVPMILGAYCQSMSIYMFTVHWNLGACLFNRQLKSSFLIMICEKCEVPKGCWPSNWD